MSERDLLLILLNFFRFIKKSQQNLARKMQCNAKGKGKSRSSRVIKIKV